MSYSKFEDGIVQTYTCELNIVHQCNLSCRGCSHLSPISSKQLMKPSEIYETLSILSECFQANHIRILGGEPLLHPDLEEILEAARSAGVSKKIHLTTNGTLLSHMSKEVWEKIDQLHISVYPTFEISESDRSYIEGMAQEYDVEIRIVQFNDFREPYAELGTQDTSLVRRVYKTCLIAHDWCCYTVQDGYFFKCNASVFLPRNLKISPDVNADGVKIKRCSDLGQRIWNYITDPTPLKSCFYCLGSVGKKYPHEIVARKNWRSFQSSPTENLMDIVFLEELEMGNDSNYGCIDDWENQGVNPIVD